MATPSVPTQVLPLLNPNIIVLKPFEEEAQRRQVSFPPHQDNPVAFRQVEHMRSAIDKHWKFTIQDPAPGSSILEIEVTDGLRRKSTIQVILGNLIECSCAVFVEDGCNMCDHLGALLNLLKNRYLYEIYGNKPEVQAWVSQYHKKIAQTKAHKSTACITTYDSFTRSFVKVGNTKSTLAPQIDSVASIRLKATQTPTQVFPASNEPPIASSGILGSGLQLYDYQEGIFQRMVPAKKGVLSLVVGSGKTLVTITALGYVQQVIHPGKPISVLVVCPKSLKIQWKNEFKRALDLECNLVNTKNDLVKLGSKSVDIVTFQLFTRHVDEFVKQGYQFVVIDEIQFIRNDESKIWKACKKLNSEYFFGLSGTVIENKLDDLYSVLDVIHPGFLGPKWRFCYDFQWVKGVNKKEVIYKGIRNEEVLREKIKPYVFAYNNLKLPPIQQNYLEVPMTHNQKHYHDNFYYEAKKLLAKSLSSGLNHYEKTILQSFLLKARQASNSETLITKNPTSQPSPKITRLLGLVQQLTQNNNQKVVVFSEWTEMLDLIIARVAPGTFVKFTGKESEKQRFAAITKFKTDPECSLFLSTDAGGVGVDGLQLVCHNMVHMELPWNPAKIEQRNGRIHRLLQQNPVQIHFLVSSGSIETHLRQVLTQKAEIRKLALEDLSKP